MASRRSSSVSSHVDFGSRNANQMRFESSSDDDDDDDEHKLQIDLGSAEDEDDDSSSHESHENGVVPCGADNSLTSNSDCSKTDPLQSLQMLAHSPYSNAQISSAADDSGVQGCESVSAENIAASSNSFFSVTQQSSPSPLTSSSSQLSCAISVTPVPGFSLPSNALPQLTLGPGAFNLNHFSEVNKGAVDGEKSSREVSPSTIRRVLKKLNSAATDEINLRTLLDLPSEEANSFNHFRKMLSNHPQYDGLQSLNSIVGGPTFGTHNLASLMRHDVQCNKPYSIPMVRNPPALTVISTLDAPSVTTSRKSNCRRSPPPMVPISSFRNCNSSGNFGGSRPSVFEEDNVINRLKRLGTDVAVEPPYNFEDEEEDDDEEPYYPINVDCVLSTEPTVTKPVDKFVLPSLMPIPSEQAKSISISRVQPPPPSLIPINCPPKSMMTMATTQRFIPILPRVPPLTWSQSSDPAATLPYTTTISSRSSNNVFSTNRAFQITGAAASTTSVIAPKKQKKTKPSNKSSQFSRLANYLVLPASASKKVDPIILAESVLAEALRPKSSTRVGELEIIKVPSTNSHLPKSLPSLSPSPPASAPSQPALLAPSFQAPQPDVTRLVMSVVPPPSQSAPQPSTSSQALSANITTFTSVSARSNYFEFSLKKFGSSTVMTNNHRKLFACCVCSTVYHKMFSLKKHFYRTHVNPFYVSRQDALKYDVTLPQNQTSVSSGAGAGLQNDMYKCDTCLAMFGDVEPLRTHLLEHRPPNYDYANRFRCSGCNLVFRKEKVFTRHLLECASYVASSFRPVPTPPPVAVPVRFAQEPVEELPVPVPNVVVAAPFIVPSDDAKNGEEVVAAPTPEFVTTTPIGATVMASTQPDNAKAEAEEKTDDAINTSGSANMMCLFCEVTFKDNTERQKHVLQNHHPKRKHQRCTYCKKKDISDLRELLQHICDVHHKRYFGCARCKIRFKTKDELTAHRMESHPSDGAGNEKTASAVERIKSVAAIKPKNGGRTFKCGKCQKLCSGMTELLSHRKAAHHQPKAKIKHQRAIDSSGDFLVTRAKYAPFSSDDYETEFYRNIAQNVKTNLECYLDGKLDSQPPAESKCTTRSSLINNFISSCSNSSGTADEKRVGELGFIDMYGAENFNAAFLRNASRLHIGTQLTMLKKTNLLHQDYDSETQPSSSCSVVVSVPSKLSLTPQKLNTIEDGGAAADEIAGTSKDGLFTGEWVRPRRYVCKVCLARFTGFWEIDDHFWAKHPNVRHSYYEFPLDQDPGLEFLQMCKVPLSNVGACGKADIKWTSSAPASECTKCGVVVTPLAEFHKHILECGGDTNWMATMYTPTKKHKKWRPYSGHRRRRAVTKNRMFVRNIPETPMKMPNQVKGKPKAGDSDTIQKMIANLPAKRITRRVVNFDDVERSRSRFLARSSVLTRRRREQLDPKTSARIAKAFAVDNFDVMSIIRRKRKGSKKSFKSSSTGKSQQNPVHVSDRAMQPIVQVEAIKIENRPDLADLTCSTISGFGNLTIKEAPDVKIEINCQEKQISASAVKVSTEEPQTVPLVNVPEGEAHVEVSLVTVTPADVPVVEASTAIPLVEVSTDVSSVEVFPSVPLVDDSAVVSCINDSVIALPAEISDSVIVLPAEIPEAVIPCSTEIPEAVIASSTEISEVVIASSIEMPEAVIASPTEILEALPSEVLQTASATVAVPVEGPVKVHSSKMSINNPSSKVPVKFSNDKTIVEVAVCETVHDILEPEAEDKHVNFTESPVVSTDKSFIKNHVALITAQDNEVDDATSCSATISIVPPIPADRQSPSLPDSSVILEAMRETLRQTDTVAPNTVYGGRKKRKRGGSKQSKCKKCGSRTSKGQQQCVNCNVKQQQQLRQKQQQQVKIPSSPPQKKCNDFLQFVCESCGSEVFSTARDGKICDMCLQKTNSKARDDDYSSNVENIPELPTTPPLPVSLKRTCVDCGCTLFSSPLSENTCDKCTSLKRVCISCEDKFNIQNDETVCSKCTLAAAAAQTVSTSAASNTVPVTTSEKVTETIPHVCRLCEKTCANSLTSDVCDKCLPKTPTKQSHLPESCVTPKSPGRPEFDGPAAIVTLSLASQCESEIPPPPLTSSCEELVKDGLCIHCGAETIDRNDSGNPACRMCHELWITLNTNSVELVKPAEEEECKCLDCGVLVTNGVTFHQLCHSCQAKKNTSVAAPALLPSDPIVHRRRSSEVSVQVGEPGSVHELYTRAAKMPMLTPAVPCSSTTPLLKMSDELSSKMSAAASKNTLLLICKGCYNTYGTVSAYKDHRAQCPFRNSDDEASKKPLLGFAKRSIKSGVEIVQIDSPGAASFELLDSSLLQLHEEAGSTSNVSLKVESSDNTSGQCTSNSDFDLSPVYKRLKPKIATDESMQAAIDSVVQKFCSTSTPIAKREEEDEVEVDEGKRESQVAAESAPDTFGTDHEPMATTSSLSHISVKKGKKRVRTKPVDSPTRARNMKTVEGEVVKMLQSTKSKKLTCRKVFTFPDDTVTTDIEKLVDEELQSTKSKKLTCCKVFTSTDDSATTDTEKLAAEESTSMSNISSTNEENVKKRNMSLKSSSLPEDVSTSDASALAVESSRTGSPIKKKLRNAKTKSVCKTRAQRKSKAASSNSNSTASTSVGTSSPIIKEEQLPKSISATLNAVAASKESFKSGGKKVARKRRAEDDVIDQSSEVRLPSRLRRKSLVTEEAVAVRVLRSRSKSEITDSSLVADESKDESLLSPKQEEDIAKPKKTDTTTVQKSETGSKETASGGDRRRPPPVDKAKVKPCDSNASAGVSTGADVDVKSKTKTTKRKNDSSDATATANSKRVRSSSQDLGFLVAKTSKSVRSNARVKDEDADECKDVAENPASNLSVHVDNVAAAAPAGTSHVEAPPLGRGESASIPSPANSQNNFLELGPSVPHSYLLASTIGERPASVERINARRSVAEEESMANHLSEQSNDHEQQQQQQQPQQPHQLSVESQSDANSQDTLEMTRIQQELDRSFNYVSSMSNAVSEVLRNSEDPSDCPLDSSLKEELEELKKYADVASEAILALKSADKDKKMDDCSVDMNHDYSSLMLDVDEPPKLYCELESQYKNSKDFIVHRSGSNNASQNNAVKTNAIVVNGAKTAVKNGNKINKPTNKSQANGVTRKLRCNHCQKVVQTKNEMAIHIQDHFRKFALSKRENAILLKKCIADKLEQLLMDKAVYSYLKFTHLQELNLSAPIKILTQPSSNQLEKWKLVVAQLVLIENEEDGAPSNESTCPTVGASASKIESNAVQSESSFHDGDSKPVSVTERTKNGECYRCPLCSTTYDQKHLRNRHLMLVHTRHPSSQKLMFDVDLAKSARANLNVDSVINANAAASKKDAASTEHTKSNGVLFASPSTTVATPASTSASSAATNTTMGATTTTSFTSIGVNSKKVNLATLSPLDPSSLPPQLLPANVEMPAPSRKCAAARQTPPALTISNPKLANINPKPALLNQPSTAAAASITAPRMAAPAAAVRSRSNATSGAAAVPPRRNASGVAVAAPLLGPPVPAGRRSRKKMSRKELNVPPHVIRQRAEAALRELTGNRFNRF